MGFLDKLLGRGKSTPQPQSPPERNVGEASDDIAPTLAPALAAFQADDYIKAHALASQHLDNGADAQRLCALSLSALNQHEAAFPHWLALFEAEPTAHNALQLATVSVMCHEVDRGEAWLAKFHQLNEQSHDLPPALAGSNFISALEQAGHGDRAMPHLQWLRDGYAHFSITDAHFLHMRGMPFFNVFLERSLPLLQQQLAPAEIAAWYLSIRDRLDANGQAALDVHLASIAGIA